MAHPAELRREQRRKISQQLLEDWKSSGANPGKGGFLRLQEALLKAARPGSPEAVAIGEVTWDEVRDDLDAKPALFKNLVPCRHAANVAGVDVSDFYDAMRSRGFGGNLLERKQIRQVLTTVYMRSDDPDAKEKIKAAIHTFADEPETSIDLI